MPLQCSSFPFWFRAWKWPHKKSASLFHSLNADAAWGEGVEFLRSVASKHQQCNESSYLYRYVLTGSFNPGKPLLPLPGREDVLGPPKLVWNINKINDFISLLVIQTWAWGLLSSTNAGKSLPGEDDRIMMGFIRLRWRLELGVASCLMIQNCENVNRYIANFEQKYASY